MWFGILGPIVTVREEGSEINLGPPQRRELLAFLLSRPNQVASLDAIIEALWAGEARPEGARTSVQAHLSRLRSTIGADRITTRAPGYLIRVAPDELDLLVFRQFVKDGNALAARGLLNEAFEQLARGLSLWRGEPFSDFMYSEWAQSEIVHLNSERSLAEEDQFDLALELGFHREVLAEVEVALAARPGNERLSRQLATALYRCGRQTAALHLLARLRSYLLDELGLDVSPETSELETRILQHSESLHLVVAEPKGADTEVRTAAVLLAEVGYGEDLPAADEAFQGAVEGVPKRDLLHPVEGVRGAVFDALGSAVATALSLVSAGVGFRVAIHAGVLQPGVDGWRGLAIHKALRILGIAQEGTVVVSAAAHELSEEGVSFDEVGEVELPGVTGRERLWAVDDPLLRRFDRVQFSRRLTNLPAQVSTFVGRIDELAELGTLVTQRRLVTVTGPGGVGKTRLGLQVAADLAGDLADGVWLVELAPVGDPDLIAVTVLEALGIARSGEVNAAEFLLEVLEGRQLLLLVDNCEHLIDAASDLIESLLKIAPGVKVLATSRQPLGIPGEFVYPIPPLSLQGAADSRGWETLEDRVDAFGLFLERARAVSPLALDEASYPLVDSICRRLDGLPLALELAAAQLSTLTLEDLADLVEHELSRLESPYRNIPSRQRTIQAAVDWSYRLLTPTEQLAFRRLAVFTGDFSLEAARAICAPPTVDGDQANTILGRLVERSMLDRLPEGRFQLLGVLRHAGSLALQKAGEEDETTRSHALYYLQQAIQTLTHTRGPQQVEWILRTDLDWPNLRGALVWALQYNPDQGAQAVIGLTDYFRFDHGWEGIEWTNRYLGSIDDKQVMLELHRTRALAAMAPSVHDVMVESAEYILNDPPEADADTTHDALVVLGMKGVETGDAELVSDITARMEALGLETPRALRRLAGFKSFDHRFRGDLEGAAEWMRKARDLTSVSGEVWGLAGLSNNLADVLMHLGRLDEALAIIDEAVGHGRYIGSRIFLALSLTTRAEILYRMGRPLEGLDSALRGLEISHQASSRFEIISGAEVVAALLLKLGRTDDAAAMHAVSHGRAIEWNQEGTLAQFALYHEDLVSTLNGLPAEQRDRATRRGITTPIPVLIDQVRWHSSR